MPDSHIVDAYDWNWWDEYGPQVAGELQQVFLGFLLADYPGAPPQAVNELAARWASERGAALLRLDGDLNLMNATRERVRRVVADGLEQGKGVGQIAKALREDPIFGRKRAELVARTETATAQGQGRKESARMQGRNEKRWVTQGDSLVTPECQANEAAGWIGMDERFPSGPDTIPQHPRCRCTNIYRTVEVPERATGIILAEAHCPPPCGRLLGKHVQEGARLWCPRCHKERVIVAPSMEDRGLTGTTASGIERVVEAPSPK